MSEQEAAVLVFGTFPYNRLTSICTDVVKPIPITTENIVKPIVCCFGQSDQSIRTAQESKISSTKIKSF